MITQPLYNTLILIYNWVPGQDLGVAIIILTLLVKLVFYPLSAKAIKSQETLKLIQPELEKIQKKYKNEKEKQVAELMGLYKKYKINPISSIWPILIQLPILFGLYKVFMNDLSQVNSEWLYTFVSAPEVINTSFVGLINLTEKSKILAIITAALQFVQMKISLAKSPALKDEKSANFGNILNKQMLFIMPLMMFFIGSSLPAALPLFWLVSTVFGVFQQYLLTRKKVCEVMEN